MDVNPFNSEVKVKEFETDPITTVEQINSLLGAVRFGAKLEVIREEKFLRQKSLPATFAEATLIWELLEKFLSDNNETAISSCQIGILKRVFVIRIGNKFLRFLNPEIVSKSDEFVFYQEGCLSFPKIFKNTLRYKSVEISDENTGHFISNIETDGLLPVLLLHECDHLEGILFFDRMQKPITIINKPSRNELCPCGSGKKYKKCCLLFE